MNTAQHGMLNVKCVEDEYMEHTLSGVHLKFNDLAILDSIQKVKTIFGPKQLVYWYLEKYYWIIIRYGN